MRYFIFLILILLSSCLLQPKPSDCRLFKNGKFRTKIDGREYFIDRSGAIQKEYFFNRRDSAAGVFNVKWLDDCTYTLTPTEETRIKLKIPENKKMVLTVRITGATVNSYTQTSSFSFTDQVSTSEVFKIE